jgi:CHAT domain-containing protein
MFSRVMFQPGGVSGTDDGRLEVHELLGMRIGAALVFLSGCETGLGAAWSTRYAQGEDYATLAQAFLYAGAQNVLATLWRIEDRGAAVVAERFYQGLRSHPPVEALANAQRALIESAEYAAPYYWAAYQISGSGL